MEKFAYHTLKASNKLAKERGSFEEPKYYYRPIPETHVTVNPNLTQNFGWN